MDIFVWNSGAISWFDLHHWRHIFFVAMLTTYLFDITCTMGAIFFFVAMLITYLFDITCTMGAIFFLVAMLTTYLFDITFFSGFFDEIQDTFLMAWHLKWKLLVSFSPFLIVLVAFVAFVRWNGSVVLGAKEAHAVSPHFAQIMYFSLISALFMAPLLFTLRHATVLVQTVWKNGLLSFFQWFMALTAGFLSVHYFSMAHPYLLADNRHYTFYLWRKVINAHWSMKYLLVPLYIYSWFSIFVILAKAHKKIWVLSYFLACAAVLIPAPLIELRYYTIPFFFLVLHSNANDYKSWLLTSILYIAINIFTMIMFLFQPFYWNHEPGIQRFIW